MGTLLPNNPIVEQFKWYIVHFEARFPDPTPCGGALHSTRQCCVQGGAILTWIENRLQCNNIQSLCGPVAGMHNKLVGWDGPFDTFAACQLVV